MKKLSFDSGLNMQICIYVQQLLRKRTGAQLRGNIELHHIYLFLDFWIFGFQITNGNQ